MNPKFIQLSAVLLASTLVSAGAAAAGNADAGAKKNSMCIGCHGIDGYRNAYPEVYRIPKLGGQNAEYIVRALNGYKKGERNHETMRAIASSLSEQDMADLAAYYAGK